jgi:putative ABC transport system ATP-binding protein
MDAICILQDVVKRYGQHAALTVDHLAIAQGEMVAITGRSGAGKTTLLNLIGLLEPPSEGRIELFGHPAPRPWSGAASTLRRMRLGYLFQNYALVDDQTVDDNLDLALPQGRALEARAIKDAALDRVGLSPAYAHRPVYTLSGGEQQRVAIARLLIKPCDLILADEPTGSLDPANQAAVLTLLRHLNQTGKTLIIVTHDETVARACDRHLVVNSHHLLLS